MARVAGVMIPDDKQVLYSLQYIKGIGLTTSRKILAACSIDASVRVKSLAEGELVKIQDYIREHLVVEGDMQRVVRANIKRLKDIGSYRGMRHHSNLPSRGQRTRTNARTKRGKRIAVGGAQPKSAEKT